MGRPGIRSDLSKRTTSPRSPAADPSSIIAEKAENRARWPELRIVRETNIAWPGHEDWDRYVNVFGRLNRGIGDVASYGSMALSHVTAQEMGKMLQKKFSKPYEQRRSTIQLHRRIAENFNQFVGRQERYEIEAMNMSEEQSRAREESDDIEAIMARLDRDCDDAAYDILLERKPEPTGIIWGIGIFAVRAGLEKFSRNALGLDLTANDQLYTERQEIISFLEGEDLDTRMIDRTREPHLTVIGTYGIAGSVKLKHVDHPPRVTLDAPRALANNNTPTSS